MTSAVLLLASIVAAGTSDSEFAVRIEIRRYPVIDHAVYSVSSKEVVVSETHSQDELYKEVFRGQLGKHKSKSFGAFLRGLPLEELQAEYDNPDIQDGFVLTCEVSVGGRPTKTVVVSNVREERLADLCAEINKLVPRRFEIQDLMERHFTTPID